MIDVFAEHCVFIFIVTLIHQESGVFLGSIQLDVYFTGVLCYA